MADMWSAVPSTTTTPMIPLSMLRAAQNKALEASNSLASSRIDSPAAVSTTILSLVTPLTLMPLLNQP